MRVGKYVRPVSLRDTPFHIYRLMIYTLSTFTASSFVCGITVLSRAERVRTETLNWPELHSLWPDEWRCPAAKLEVVHKMPGPPCRPPHDARWIPHRSGRTPKPRQWKLPTLPTHWRTASPACPCHGMAHQRPSAIPLLHSGMALAFACRGCGCASKKRVGLDDSSKRRAATVALEFFQLVAELAEHPLHIAQCLVDILL